MEPYITLFLLKEDHTIKLRFETKSSVKGAYFHYTVSIRNGEILKEKMEGMYTKIPLELIEKVALYKEVSKRIYPMVSSGEMAFEELLYEEKKTIGLLPDWRYTKEQKVEYRTVCELTYKELRTNNVYVFHIDPKDEVYRLYLQLGDRKVDITNVTAKEIKENIKHFFLNESKYRLKILYLKNNYQ